MEVRDVDDEDREALRLKVRSALEEALGVSTYFGDIDEIERRFPYEGRRSLHKVKDEFAEEKPPEGAEEEAFEEYELGNHRPLMLNDDMASDLIRVIDVYTTMTSNPDAHVKARLQILRRRLVTIKMLTSQGPGQGPEQEREWAKADEGGDKDEDKGEVEMGYKGFKGVKK